MVKNAYNVLQENEGFLKSSVSIYIFYVEYSTDVRSIRRQKQTIKLQQEVCKNLSRMH